MQEIVDMETKMMEMILKLLHLFSEKGIGVGRQGTIQKEESFNKKINQTCTR